jgi:hypothetical protein
MHSLCCRRFICQTVLRDPSAATSTVTSACLRFEDLVTRSFLLASCFCLDLFIMDRLVCAEEFCVEAGAVDSERGAG